MFIYWVMFLIPAMAALSTTKFDKQLTNFGWALLAIFFILILGLRSEVGIDWFNSLYSFNRLKNISLSEAISTSKFEPVYAVLCWIINQMDFSILGVNLIGSIIFLTGLTVFCRRQPNSWLALSIAVPFLVIVVGMGYNRQASAIGCLLLAFISLADGYIFRFALLIALGSLFHATLLLLMPLGLIVCKSKRFWQAKNFWTWIWMGVIGILLFYYLLSEYLDVLKRYYFGIRMTSDGAFIRAMMCAIPATIFLLFRKQFNLSLVQQRLWTWISIASITCFAMVEILPSSSAVDRFAYYLIPIQLFVYSRLPLLFQRGISRQALTLTIITCYAIIQFVFLNYAAHAHGWLPYKFYPLEAF